MPVPRLRRGVSTASNVRPSCSNNNLQRNCYHDAIQVRTLWWWGRHAGGWLSSVDENLEERVRRHHKIMRSRYSRVMRRKALWEHEDHRHWPWRKLDRFWTTRYCDHKPLSSKGNANQQDPPLEPDKDFLDTHKDFDSFKAAVDRAIAKDPYGTIFGRRLQSPPTSNTSSWTSFSWMSNRKEMEEAEQSRDSNSDSLESANKSTATVSPSAETTASGTDGKPANTDSETEYEYDPISMRKVPIKKQRAEAEPKKPFLQALFSENGVDIPVKTYSPHKVYAYGPAEQTSEGPRSDTDPSVSSTAFFSSRKRELRELMARSKGNTIDTTALFTETPSPSNIHQDAGEFATSRQVRESPEPDDTLPLFSGTTYEAKLAKQEGNTPSDWLTKEGFRQSRKDPSTNKDSSVEIPVKKLKNKLEPALDRIQAYLIQNPGVDSYKLQPALDRQITASKPVIKRAEVGPEALKTPPLLDPAKQQDADLHQEGDVLAVAELKHRKEKEAKKKAWEKLQADFEARQNEKEDIGEFFPEGSRPETPTSKLTKTLNNVWDHIRDYPNGIVAKTMKSVGALNENYKRYIRPETAEGLTDKLIFQDESLSKTPSIYRKRATPSNVKSFTPSPEVLDAEKERMDRTAALQAESERLNKDAEIQSAKFSQLANDIKAVYESEYGAIEPNHRQRTSTPQNVRSEDAASTPPAPPPPPPRRSSPSESTTSKPHPLASASVRPGVHTNPVVDQHVSKFEPQFAEIVDSTKKLHSELRDIGQMTEELRARQPLPHSKFDMIMEGTREVRRKLHDTQGILRAIESRRPEIAWDSPHTSGADFGKKRIDLKAKEVSESPATPLDSISEKPSSLESEGKLSSVSPTKAEPKTVPEPFVTPSASPAWNDKLPPPLESLKGKTFDSTYLILSYNPSTGKVDFSPMNEPTTEISKRHNPLAILSKLNNAPEFLKHFKTMQRAGYSLFSGTEDMLIFKKKQAEQSAPSASQISSQSISNVEKTAASDDVQNHQQPVKEPAIVFDDLPIETNPLPGPAAPTAPPSRPLGSLGSQPKVRRQEKVFSGTIRPNASLPSSNTESEGKSSASHSETSPPKSQKESRWKRFTRGIKRTILTIAALGGAAYAIGFVAEGMGAHNQKQNGIEDAHAQGPRKRIVMTGQRPGIFSTESSR